MDLPAPFRPMMPSTSPCRISKEISLSAHKNSGPRSPSVGVPSECRAQPPKRRTKRVGKGIPQRAVTLPLAQPVSLADSFAMNDYVAHNFR